MLEDDARALDDAILAFEELLEYRLELLLRNELELLDNLLLLELIAIFFALELLILALLDAFTDELELDDALIELEE